VEEIVMHKRVLIGASFALLGGCANWNSIHHDFRPNDGDSLSIDAKQRVVYTVTKKYKDNVEWKAICAEPSPDALSALSASLGVDAAVASKALGVAFSSQEAAASIGLRTQTIQTLRDAMYRLCEGYASGAIDDIGFARLQRRYQAIMLGLLSIEQLTGAVVANQAVLSGSATTRLGQNLSQITVLVDKTRAKSVAAKADLVIKTAEAEAAQKAKADAETALKKLKDDPKSTEADTAKATTTFKEKSQAASTAEEAKKTAALEDTTQAAELANLESLRKDLDRATAIASTTANLVPVSTGAKGPPDSDAFIKVAETVKDIVTTIVEHDYSKETCMDAITSRAARNLDTAAELDLFELQLNYCAFAIRDRAANIGSRSRPLSAPALTSIKESAEAFTKSAAALVGSRKAALAAAAAASAAASAADKKR
jgi:hypothetical protein